jgi:hypothetical protein
MGSTETEQAVALLHATDQRITLRVIRPQSRTYRLNQL